MRFITSILFIVLMAGLSGCLEKKPPAPTALAEFDQKCRAQKFYYFISDASHSNFCSCMQQDLRTQMTEQQFETLYRNRHASPQATKEVENLVNFTMYRCLRPIFGEFIEQMCLQAPNSPTNRLSIDESAKPQICSCTVKKLDNDYTRFFGRLDDAQQMPQVMQSEAFKAKFKQAFVTCAVGMKLMTE